MRPRRRTTRRRWLYLDTYTLSGSTNGCRWSDAIGYGVTSSPAIQRELRARGIELLVPRVEVPDLDPSSGYRRTAWITQLYARAADEIERARPDLVFAFHIFVTFPTVIRKALQDLSLSVPIVGYTHGSHWDPTDAYRFDLYPGMELQDLANLCTMDRLLLVSDYMRITLNDNISVLNEDLARSVGDASRVVGLPIDVATLDACRTDASFNRPTIVFNHAPDRGKRPAAFAAVATEILAAYDVNVLITRRFPADAPGAREIAALAERFGDRVMLGNDLSVSDYYEALWKADIQVSTATHESLGIATLEAMYAGNCCVLPRIGSYPEICGDDDRVLYRPDGPELAERLAYLITHPGERREIAAALAPRAAKFAPGPVVDRILEAVDDLC